MEETYGLVRDIPPAMEFGTHGYIHSKFVQERLLLFLLAVACAIACGRGGTPKRPASSIFIAAGEGNLDELQAHIYWKSGVDQRDGNGLAALHMAAIRGQEGAARFLIEHGADVRIKDRDGATPLHYAVSKTVAELLISKGAIVDARTNSANGPPFDGHGLIEAEWAAQTPAEKRMQEIIEGKTIRAVGRTALHSAATRCSVEVMDVLFAHGADVNARTATGATVLHLAGDKNTVQWALAHGIDVNALDNYKRTPLHWAVGNVEVARVLLINGANVNAKDDGGETPKDLTSDPAMLDLLQQNRAGLDETKNDLQPISWEWIKAVLLSSLVVLLGTSGIMIPVTRLLEPTKLNRMSTWIRWILVVPTAFLMGLLGEILPRILFALIEVFVNHELLFRPGVDSVIWQFWAPLLFVAGGVQMAPRFKFGTFLVVGGLKIVVAVVNLVRVLQFTIAGGPWSAIDPITNSPLWWNSAVYVITIAVLGLFGSFLVKQAVWRQRLPDLGIATPP